MGRGRGTLPGGCRALPGGRGTLKEGVDLTPGISVGRPRSAAGALERGAGSGNLAVQRAPPDRARLLSVVPFAEAEADALVSSAGLPRGDAMDRPIVFYARGCLVSLGVCSGAKVEPRLEGTSPCERPPAATEDHLQGMVVDA